MSQQYSHYKCLNNSFENWPQNNRKQQKRTNLDKQNIILYISYSGLIFCLIVLFAYFNEFLTVNERKNIQKFTTNSKLPEGFANSAGSQIGCQNVGKDEEELLFPQLINKYVLAENGDCGGMANQMYRFASLYGIAKTLNRKAALFKAHFEFCENETDSENKPGDLESIFPIYWRNLEKIDNESLVNFDSEMVKFEDFGNFGTVGQCCRFDNPAKYNFAAIEKKFIILGKRRGNYFQNYRYFHSNQKQIRQIFKFSPEICQKIAEYSPLIFGPNLFGHKFCVHTRKGDFQGYGFESDKEFTEKAANFVGQELKKIYGNISIVLLGQDKEFLEHLAFEKKLFSHIYLPKGMGRGEDMAFAVGQCHSLLITAPQSTYSFWIAYLMAPNAPIYFNGQFKMWKGQFWTTRENMLPEWRALGLVDGKIQRI